MANLVRTSLRRIPLALRRLPSGAGDSVLLTFDDGPVPDVTDRILDCLDSFSARAVFFALGRRVDEHPDLVKEVGRRGHAVANHSYTHPMGRLPLVWSYVGDVQRCSRAIERATGNRPGFFRAPGGYVHPGSLLVPAFLKMKHVLWSFDSLDWQCPSVDEARQAAAKSAEIIAPGDIVLLHDYAAKSLAYLEELLPRLQDRGMDFSRGLSRLQGP